MTRGEKKFLILFGLTLVLWRLVELPAVQNAFIQFLAAGQVPGMEKTLSPKGVFWVLAGVFSISLILIFWTDIKRSFGKRRIARVASNTANNTASNATDSDYKDISNRSDGQPVVIARPRSSRAAHIPHAKLSLKDKKMPVLYVPSIRPFAKKVRVFLGKVGVVLRKGAAAEYDSLKTIFTFIWKVVVFVGLFVWRFAEPRIRKLDKWLERKLHKNPVASEIMEIVQECWRAVTSSRPRTEKTEEAKQA